jgi:HPr kinase/phosphorylase
MEKEDQTQGITVESLLADPVAHLDLRLIAGKEGLKRKISTTDPNRPGLALTGYTQYFHEKSVQVFGKQEISYLEGLGPRLKKRFIEKIFHYNFPCSVITWSMSAPKEMIEASNSYKRPLLGTSMPTTRFIIALTHYLESKFASQTTLHGGLVDVYGVGVLILGKSGVGKSECALELLERGHRLVADDVVEIRSVGGMLIGRSAKLIQHHMEIRGLGIINIKDLFGARAICPQKQIELVVNLEEWQKDKEYDRLGLDESAMDILGISIPKLIIPVRPGRNIAVIVEVAAMNYRLKESGKFSAREFNLELLNWIRKAKKPEGIISKF